MALDWKDSFKIDSIPNFDGGYGSRITNPGVFTPKTRGGGLFSARNALEGFKSLLDVSRAQGDRRTQGSYGQGFGFQGYGNSRVGQGAFIGGTPGYTETRYFGPETPTYLGGGGQAGGGGDNLGKTIVKTGIRFAASQIPGVGPIIAGLI